LNGTWWGPKEKDECASDWRFKQCDLAQLYLFYGVGGVLGILLLIILICICRCCLCKKRTGKKVPKNFKEFKTLKLQEEEKEGLLSKSKHPVTDKRREEMRQKHGSMISSSKV